MGTRRSPRLPAVSTECQRSRADKIAKSRRVNHGGGTEKTAAVTGAKRAAGRKPLDAVVHTERW